MEKIILAQNKHWRDIKYSGLVPRHITQALINKLPLKEINVLLGIRRSGKSSVFKLLINHLIDHIEPTEILYINLDDPYFSEIWNDPKSFYSIIETAEKLSGIKPRYLFFDEIQNVKGWEKFIKSIYDSEQFKKIFITGSSSSLLTGTYARLLSGRYIADYVHPFSLKELLEYKGITSYKELVDNTPSVMRLVDEMLLHGSFPEVFKTESAELKRDILLNYYDTIVLKDCIANNSIRDIRTFKEVAFYGISNIGCIYSYNSVARAVDSNENTVKEFIQIHEDSFLFQEVRNFSYKLRVQAKGKKKCYCVDNGLISAISFKFSENKGRLFENLVFTEFLKNSYKEIYFYRDQKECDFIMKKGRNIIAVQVVYTLDGNNRKREIEGLKTAMEKLNIPRGIIITFNQQEMASASISVIPFWKIYEEVLSGQPPHA